MEQLISAKDWRARVPRSQITTRKRASNADDVPTRKCTHGVSHDFYVQKLLKRSTPPAEKSFSLHARGRRTLCANIDRHYYFELNP
jgi:hypothetical protein